LLQPRTLFLNGLNELPDGRVAEYVYDPFGRRIEKNVNGAVVKYLYDNEDIIAEYGSSGELRTEYVHGIGIDEPLMMARNGENYFYHTDGLGSITALTDQSGATVQRYEYDSFGEIISVSDPSFIQPYTYTAREYDPETGLYYYRARYYDAEIGRFMSEDPIGFESGDINLYRYGGNNPANKTDPSGLSHLVCGRDYDGRPKCEWVEDPPVPHWLCELSVEINCEVACHYIGLGPVACANMCANLVSLACPSKCEE